MRRREVVTDWGVGGPSRAREFIAWAEQNGDASFLPEGGLSSLSLSDMGALEWLLSYRSREELPVIALVRRDHAEGRMARMLLGSGY